MTTNVDVTPLYDVPDEQPGLMPEPSSGAPFAGSDAADDADALAVPAAPVRRGGIEAWHNTTYQQLSADLKMIEEEVRVLLEPIDPRRKRKFSGTQRWIELEEDIQEWRFTSRFEEATLRRILQCIARRHYLFQRLRFLTGTRPTWNT